MGNQNKSQKSTSKNSGSSFNNAGNNKTSINQENKNFILGSLQHLVFIQKQSYRLKELSYEQQYKQFTQIYSISQDLSKRVSIIKQSLVQKDFITKKEIDFYQITSIYKLQTNQQKKHQYQNLKLKQQLIQCRHQLLISMKNIQKQFQRQIDLGNLNRKLIQNLNQIERQYSLNQNKLKKQIENKSQSITKLQRQIFKLQTEKIVLLKQKNIFVQKNNQKSQINIQKQKYKQTIIQNKRLNAYNNDLLEEFSNFRAQIKSLKMKNLQITTKQKENNQIIQKEIHKLKKQKSQLLQQVKSLTKQIENSKKQLAQLKKLNKQIQSIKNVGKSDQNHSNQLFNQQLKSMQQQIQLKQKQLQRERAQSKTIIEELEQDNFQKKLKIQTLQRIVKQNNQKYVNYEKKYQKYVQYKLQNYSKIYLNQDNQKIHQKIRQFLSNRNNRYNSYYNYYNYYNSSSYVKNTELDKNGWKSIYQWKKTRNIQLSQDGYMLCLWGQRLNIQLLLQIGNFNHIQQLKLNRQSQDSMDPGQYLIWLKLVQNSKMFPNLKILYLYNKNIQVVKQNELQRFPLLQFIDFYQNPLNKSSIKQLNRYKISHPNVIIKVTVNDNYQQWN